jgi:hypothetical protein
MESSGAHTCSLRHIEGSIRGLNRALHRGFAIGKKITLLHAMKSLEDFRITLEMVALAAKWAAADKKKE